MEWLCLSRNEELDVIVVAAKVTAAAVVDADAAVVRVTEVFGVVVVTEFFEAPSNNTIRLICWQSLKAVVWNEKAKGDGTVNAKRPFVNREIVNGTEHFQNINRCWNTKIIFYFETSGGQNSSPY